MRIAFYAPLKSPGHPVPSGDRRVGRLLIAALELAGHEVNIVSELRTYDSTGNAERQKQIQAASLSEAGKLIENWRDGRRLDPPQAWFTYHVYYKAPDWLGPSVSTALGIPYVIAEASYSPKRAIGPWSINHAAVASAIRAASLVLCPTRDDVAGISMLPGGNRAAVWLPPFLDASPYREAASRRTALRAEFERRHQLDSSVPWIAVVAMMRPGDKMDSYRMLAASLQKLRDLRWHVLIGGDGEGRTEVQAMFESSAPGRARYLGQLDPMGVAELYASSDICAWPGVNEAYGMAMLEAQAAGLPVVSRAVRGIPDVVVDGQTGLLASPESEQDFVACLRKMILEPAQRESMGASAARFVAAERDLPQAAIRLNDLLAQTLDIRSRAAISQ